MSYKGTHFKHTEKTKRKLSKNNPWKGIGFNTGKKFSEEWKKNLSIAHMGHEVSVKTKQKMSKAHKGHKFTDEQIKSFLRRRIPTRLEDEFLGIVNRNNLPYKYTGDGSFIIGGKNPDFVNTNGEKIAIEVYARYYKSRDGRNIEKWKKERRKIFKMFGWKLLFFDETQVKERFICKAL